MLVVDRIEENLVVCQDVETEKIFKIDISKFKNVPKESDVIKKSFGKYITDEKKTNKRKEYIKNITNDIFE